MIHKLLHCYCCLIQFKGGGDEVKYFLLQWRLTCCEFSDDSLTIVLLLLFDSIVTLGSIFASRTLSSQKALPLEVKIVWTHVIFIIAKIVILGSNNCLDMMACFVNRHRLHGTCCYLCDTIAFVKDDCFLVIVRIMMAHHWNSHVFRFIQATNDSFIFALRIMWCLSLMIVTIVVEKEDFMQRRCRSFSLLTIDAIAVEKEDFMWRRCRWVLWWFPQFVNVNGFRT